MAFTKYGKLRYTIWLKRLKYLMDNGYEGDELLEKYAELKPKFVSYYSAIERSEADIAAGRVRNFDEVQQQMREKYGLQSHAHRNVRAGIRWHARLPRQRTCSPQAARALFDALDDARSLHATNPELSAVSTKPALGMLELREWAVRNYVIVYRIESDQIYFEHIFHQSQDFEAMV